MMARTTVEITNLHSLARGSVTTIHSDWPAKDTGTVIWPALLDESFRMMSPKLTVNTRIQTSLYKLWLTSIVVNSRATRMECESRPQ